MEPAEYDLMDRVEQSMWWYRALHTRLLAALANTTGRVLDLGCGTGGFLGRIAAARPDLARVGLDYAETAVARAAEKTGSDVVRGSANALPFADHRFDAVIAADLLCHEAVDPALALAECRRVLRPGGRLIVNMPAFAWLASAHDRRVHNARRQTAGELRAMLAAAGFSRVDAKYWNALLLPLMIVQRKIVARHAESRSDVAAYPPWLDATFLAVTALERRLPLRFPAGGSVLAVAVRP
jgi:SAM-dependent methyltransferase